MKVPSLGGEDPLDPLQYSFMENPMDRGAWQATVRGVTKESDMTYRLNNNINNNSYVEFM